MYHVHAKEGSILSATEILKRFPRTKSELLERANALFPVRVTRSWASRMSQADDALGLQVLPDFTELETNNNDVVDPVGERFNRPLPWVVHKHQDRVLLLVTRRCHLYCRYCFRRDQHDSNEPSSEEIEAAFNYLRRSKAKELILSGGDPLTLSNRRLLHLVSQGRQIVPRIRIHTRAPITHPKRVNTELLEGLQKHAPVWFVIHCNHPKELSDDVRTAIGRLIDAGIPVLNQSVLLRGVNDNPETLILLSHALMQLRVQPYYLHHTDPVPGNASFRVSIHRRLQIHAEMQRHLGGIGLPRYVIDPPDGSGKIDVASWATRRL